jgi:hypothetical protein
MTDRNTMNRKISGGLMALFLFAGCSAFETLEEKEQKYGKKSPVIEQSFASPTIRKGDTWEIYLKAFDPDGDMKTILAYLEREIGGSTPSVSHTRIKETDRREINGYIYWYPGPGLDVLQELVMIIQIEDLAGHLSNPVSLPLRIQFFGSQESPPEGVFQEIELGPVMIFFQPMGARTGP